PTIAAGQITIESTTAELVNSVANAALNTSNSHRLGRGVWDISVEGYYVSNYALIGSTGLRMFLSAPAGAGLINILRCTPTIGLQVYMFTNRYTIERDDLILTTELDANGVGQAHSCSFAVLLNKMF
ncbi:MAG: hypothetical protein ACREQF_11865, partial [Candidatus Binataceae bacterium]